MTTEQEVIRKLSAILSADVKGYSRLMTEDESSTIKTLKKYRNIMAEIINQHSGRVVDAPGDNLLAEFSSVVHAVQCSVEIQNKLKEMNDDLQDDKRLYFRIGVNIGDVVQDGENLYGEGVNIAARIEGLADPGGVCISRGAYDHVRNKLKFGYEYIGEHSVKNIKQPVRIYKILMDSKDAGKLIGDDPKPLLQPGVWATVIVAAIVLILVGYQVFHKAMAPEFETASVENMAVPLPDKPSIAVLPFDNMSGDKEQEYFSDGITEDIITALSKTPKMFVIARNSTFTYKGKSVKVQEVGRDLGVLYVLEGSVRKVGNKVRINAQLIDAKTGHHLWSEKYDRNFENIFALQDEITKKIITELHVELDEGQQARIGSKGTDNLEAYLKALQAQYYSYLGSRESNTKAQQLAKEAIAIAPDYAYAYRILGRTHILDAYLGMSKSRKESIQLAMESYEKAVALDESLASAYAGMAYVLVMIRKYDEAVRLGKKAVDLEPNSPDVIIIYAAILNFDGRWEEAMPLFKLAFRLNPKPPNTYYRHFGHALRLSGQHEEAVALLKKAIGQEPNDLLAHLMLAVSASMGGFDEEAQAAAKEILRIDPQFSVKRLTAPFKDKIHMKNACAALNKAGLSLDCAALE
ncbi:adenylate/guanylate cyclase domain-containing protein [Desulfobacula sp.]|uniref:adenylate/guanylate cyclase domain-containing protein n=1 Tax=Desulfobacula sp. TaxID=2593537 RepID=UPI00262CBE16|nr:adenylate/guanylate cyclase domain-containing protein [Desulfobacula sp.]